MRQRIVLTDPFVKHRSIIDARPLKERRAFSLLEMMTVVAIIGLIATMAITRFGHDTLSATDGSGFARRAALSLMLARRQAISEGIEAAVQMQRTGGVVSGFTIVRASGGGDEIVEETIDVPAGVTVTTASDRWQFDYTGAVVLPAGGGSIQIDGPSVSWDVTVFAATGHVRCQQQYNP